MSKPQILCSQRVRVWKEASQLNISESESEHGDNSNMYIREESLLLLVTVLWSLRVAVLPGGLSLALQWRKVPLMGLYRE